ncbi:MAG: ABC transporter ATP-binding protein [Amylibacter sp.]|jgi:simple sugar transport system ATP-binding protein|tara:strand:- start:23842 stop:25410 length:1569 start_codon:yes stop_codon:yes gene_type:complete
MSNVTQKTSGGSAACYILELQKVCKSFGLVQANKNIDLQIQPGTIHGIIGENGAGKSTLMNILYGLHRADSGSMFIDGAPTRIKSSADALSLGIGMVHQHFMLIPRFTVLENVMLGSEGGALLKLGRASTIAKLKELGQTFDMEVDPDLLVSDLNVGMRQRVEILKALKGGAKILILDEPTGVLTPQEATQLFDILNKLRVNGVTILLITHKLAEIMAITDNVSIMRGGEMVGHRKTSETNPQELAELMVGRKVLLNVEKPEAMPMDVALTVKNLGCFSSRGHKVLDNLSFEVRAGEILGIAGVSGNGQTPLMEILSGMRKPDEGSFEILGKKITPENEVTPNIMRENFIGHIPEDRHKHGLILSFEAYENMILGFHNSNLTGTKKTLDKNYMLEHCDARMEEYDIRPRNSKLLASSFSGGNQQKIVVARELYKNPKLLIVGEPTRGVDVGAIEFIHKQLIALRDRGCAIILVSVELDEIMGLSDRILVMNKGQEVATIRGEDANAQNLGLMMAGISQGAKN